MFKTNKPQCAPFCGVLIFLATSLLQAQGVMPGGVPEPAQWWSVQTDDLGGLHWIERIKVETHPLPDQGPAIGYTNYWPAPFLPAAPIPDQLELSGRARAQVTVFAVYQAADPNAEQVVWSWQSEDRTEAVLTNYRLANLRDTVYLNFPQSPRQAHLGSYWHRRQSKAAADATILLGRVPEAAALPVGRWHGPLPELIIYDRYLAPDERQRVESYLAMKYGLTLREGPEPINYVLADETIVWDGHAFPRYHHRLISLGRDDASGWRQRLAAGAEQPELLTISAGDFTGHNLQDPSSWPDQAVLITGDDDGGLDWVAISILRDQLSLARNWRMQVRSAAEQPTALRFEVGRWRETLPAGHTFWLAIDRSAGGAFAPAQTTYFPLDELQAGRFAIFRDLHWDTDGSGADVFTLMSAPPLLLAAEADLPTCDPARTGALRGRVQGGEGPYRYALFLAGARLQAGEIPGHGLFHLENLAPGDYTLVVNDHDGLEASHAFNLAASDAPQVALDATYTLPGNGEQLVLAPTLSRDAIQPSWHWTGPEGFSAHGPSVSPPTAGLYQLEIADRGCSRTYPFSVLAAGAGGIQADVYPNPVASGATFQWQAYLPDAAPLEVSLSDAQGRRLSRARFAGDRYYTGSDRLLTAGTYWLQFRSGETLLTQKILVQ